MTDSKTPPPTFRAYRIGLCTASVCTSLPASAVADRMSQENPSGIDSRWELSTDATFSGGESNPCQCPDSPEHKHYLLEC